MYNWLCYNDESGEELICIADTKKDAKFIMNNTYYQRVKVLHKISDFEAECSGLDIYS